MPSSFSTSFLAVHCPHILVFLSWAYNALIFQYFFISAYNALIFEYLIFIIVLSCSCHFFRLDFCFIIFIIAVMTFLPYISFSSEFYLFLLA